MKLSYVISIVIGISCFCLLYLGLDLNIIFSIIISVAAYYACTMVLKEKSEMQVTVDSKTLQYEKMYSEAWAIIRKIKLLEGEIEKDEIRADIVDICETSSKILTSVKENPKKTPQVRKFVDYYLPFTLNILNQYNTIEDQKLTSKESKEFMKKVETMLVRVKEACESQLNNMYETDLVSTNADIKVFETMLKTDGLVDDNMNIKIEEKEGE